MLRTLVVLLLLANLAFYAWTQGWLDGVLGASTGAEREPERLARQVHPETVKILSPQTIAANVAAASVSAAATAACLEAGPFSNNEAQIAEAELSAALPGVTWVNASSDKPGIWIVYMGRFPNREALGRRIEELSRSGVAFEEVKSAPELEPGLSLGRFEERAAADAALAQYAARGVRPVRVLELANASNARRLRVERAEPQTVSRLLAWKSATLGKGFAECSAR